MFKKIAVCLQILETVEKRFWRPWFSRNPILYSLIHQVAPQVVSQCVALFTLPLGSLELFPMTILLIYTPINFSALLPVPVVFFLTPEV